MDRKEAASKNHHRSVCAQRRLLPVRAGFHRSLFAALLPLTAALHAARVPGGLPPARPELARGSGQHRLCVRRHRVLPPDGPQAECRAADSHGRREPR